MLTTKNGKSIAVEELTWDKLVKEITATNPELAQLMECIDDDSNCVFYKASYRFGDSIISNGICYLPLTDGGSIAFDNLELPDKLRNDLSYNKKTEDPLGLMLNKTSEFFLLGTDRIQPKSLISKGQIFGIPKAIDDNNTSTSVLESNLNAGARSIFMLPKISDQAYHSRLQKHYGTTLSTPSSLQEHWALFVDIANRANCPWRCEIIYFPRIWINKLKSDEWAIIVKYLFMLHRASYSIRHKASDVWDKTFHEIEQEKHLNKDFPMQSILTARQLFMFAANIIPGFKPATNNDSAPINLLMEVYNKIYNKNVQQKQSPIIMVPAKFNLHYSKPIYYSINHSSFAQNHLNASNQKSQIALINQIRQIFEIFIKCILEKKSNVESLYEIAQKATFAFYHSSPEDYLKIYSAAILAKEDPRFTQDQCGEFPYSSPFFKGCIKIACKS